MKHVTVNPAGGCTCGLGWYEGRPSVQGMRGREQKWTEWTSDAKPTCPEEEVVRGPRRDVRKAPLGTKDGPKG